jgi:hypothetical protein
MLNFLVIASLLLVTGAQSSTQSFFYQSENNLNRAQEEGTQYTIDRLQRHFDLLNQFNKKNKKDHLVDWETKALVPLFSDCDIDCASYKHDCVVLCLKQMKASRTIDPFFETWNIFLKNYRHVETELFVKEMSVLLFFLYKNILFSLDKKKLYIANELSPFQDTLNDRVTMPEIVALYNKISLLPINEVLFALDHCYIRLVLILKEYEFYSSMSWLQWIEKYWWLPPVIVAGIIYRIFFYKFVVHLLGTPGRVAPR